MTRVVVQLQDEIPEQGLLFDCDTGLANNEEVLARLAYTATRVWF